MNTLQPYAPINIGVFYDGNYFMEVSRYYRYQHARKSWVSIEGLHKFICSELANKMQPDPRALCRVVDAHFFRGRYYAKDCSADQLRRDRVFDDGLMQQNVVPHFAPLRQAGEFRQERGIDVWFALEAYELTLYKRFNAVVLIACDGDYVPLVHKLNILGTQVMVLAWEFEYAYMQDGVAQHRHKQTRVSSRLLEEASYHVYMHEVIDSVAIGDDARIDALFYDAGKEQSEGDGSYESSGSEATLNALEGQGAGEDQQIGRILSIHEGYGFIEKPPHNVFFRSNEVIGNFEHLKPGDQVSYIAARNNRGQDIALRLRLMEDDKS